MTHRLRVLCLLVAAAGCGPKGTAPTQAIVDITARGAASHATTVRARIFGGPAGKLVELRVVDTLPKSGWPIEIAIEPADDQTDHRWRVEAWALQGDEALGAGTVSGGFQSNQLVSYQLVLQPGADIGPVPGLKGAADAAAQPGSDAATGKAGADAGALRDGGGSAARDGGGTATDAGSKPVGKKPGNGDGGGSVDSGPTVDPLCMAAVCDPAATCSSKTGTAVCKCVHGYTDVYADGTLCVDINECLVSGICPNDSTCVNTKASFKCDCNLGFAPDPAHPSTCIDACAALLPSCDPLALCMEPQGTASCRCPAGFVDVNGDGTLCDKDVACMLLGCDPVALCDGAAAVPTCTCPGGYTDVAHDGTRCEDIDECATGNPCDAHASCTNTQGGFFCQCAAGFTGDGSTCTDIDECTLHLDNCDADASCSNTPGSFTCGCPVGYAGNGVTCADLDECALGTANCAADAVCTNAPGSYSCACKTGFSGDGVTCTDIDECSTGAANCKASAPCANTPGSYTCGCAAGYSMDGSGVCVDVDECAAGTANCSVNAQCMNTTGAYTCACKTGYSGDGVHCLDVDECTTATSNCSGNAFCANTPGSFTCTCKSGYSGDGVTCTDIDECANRSDDCNATRATCTNTQGGFTCACIAGYTGNGVTCTDVDECLAGTDTCDHSPNACVNTSGSFTCACPTGYSGTGVGPNGCTDNDECAASADNCDHTPNACVNTPGSFVCICPGGYSGSGVGSTGCMDVNECSAGTSNCSSNASCGNTTGSFTCTCNNGYTGSGVSCSDVDECSTNMSNCSSHATCSNTVGSFSCACSTGYVGNGVNCVTQGSLTIADGASYGFGAVAVNGSADHFLYITNSGGYAASAISVSGLGAPIDYRGGTFPGSGGNCGTTLAAGATCSLVLRFAPTSAGAAGTTMTINYDGGSTSRMTSITLTGSGTNLASLSITDFPTAYYSQYGLPPDAASFDFGVNGVGNVATHTFYVTNTGAGQAANIAGAALSPTVFAFKGGGTAPGAGGTCTSTLAPGASCSLVVTFTPSSVTGYSSMISLGYDDGLSQKSATRPLAGSGTNAAVLTVNDFNGVNIAPVFDYGTVGVGTPSDHKFVVANNGNANATTLSAGSLGASFSFKGGSFPGQGGTCASPIAPGSVCSVVVTCRPAVTGLVTASVTLGYFDGSAMRSANRNVRATGTSQALLIIAPHDFPSSAYDFGAHGLGSNTDVTLIVSNVGAVMARSLSVPTTAAPFSVKGTNCSSSLAAGSACAVVVTFHPTTVGPAYDALRISYDDGASGQNAIASLAGTGTDKAVLLVADDSQSNFSNPNPFSFGTTGSAMSHTFYVTNVGAVDATSVSITSPASPFSVTANSCASSVTAGSSCQITVTFAPAGAGSFGGTLKVSYNDGATARSSTRDMTGSGTANALISIQQCQNCGGGGGGGGGGDAPSPVDFGTTAAPVSRTLYLTNIGVRDAMAISIAGLSSPFSITNNGCGATLSIGASCSIVVTFSPTAAMTYVQAVTVNYKDSIGNQPVVTQAVSGSGTNNALLSITDCQNCGGQSDTTYFGTVGTPTGRTLYVTNSGAKDATMASVGGLSAPFSLSSSACGTTIAVGTTCTLNVTFAPMTASTYLQTLSLAFSDSTGPQPAATRALAGTGTLNALLTISDWSGGGGGGGGGGGYVPPPWDFGVWGIGNPLVDSHTFGVDNLGGADASMSTVGGLSAPFSATTTCGTVIARGAHCDVTVTFSPMQAQSFAQSLSVSYRDTTGPQPTVSRAITGTGTANAMLVLQDWSGTPQPGQGSNTYDFGTWGYAVSHQFHVYNVGGAATITLGDGGTLSSAFGYAGGFPGKDVQGGPNGTCGNVLARGAECTVNLTYTPPMTIGSQASVMSLNYRDGTLNQSVARSVSASSTTRANLVVNEWGGAGGCGDQCGPSDFGSVTVGQSSGPRQFTVFNTGALAATPLSFSSVAPNFAISINQCMALLASQGSCTLNVSFTPTATGQLTSAVHVAYGDSSLQAPLSANRNLRGSGM